MRMEGSSPGLLYLGSLVELNLENNHFSAPVERALRKHFGVALLL